MSFADTLKGLVGKGKDAAAKNADKITGAVDKAGDFIDEKTKGKYSDKIEKGKEAAKKAIPPEQSASEPDKPAPPVQPVPPETIGEPGLPGAPEQPGQPGPQV